VAKAMKRIWPALLVLLVSALFVAWRLQLYEGDPIALAEIGTRYAELDPDGTEGYDGQFSTYIALDPDPRRVAPHLDVPAYRYQRILYPLLARLIGFGNPELIPWSLIIINLIVHAGATYLLAGLLSELGVAPAYALIYGLWVGLISGVGLNLHEPLAYGLVVLAFVFRYQRRYVPMAVALGLALFAKESTLIFWLAILITDLIDRKAFKIVLALFVSGLLFGAWQIWLWSLFGMPGIGSGGEMATPFEFIPFMGFIRIGFVDLRVFGLYLLIFGPTVIFPTIYTLIQSIKMYRNEQNNEYAWSAALNSALIILLPFSTAREPLGLVRIFSGVVLSFVLLNARIQNRRNLNYAYFWIAMLALVISQQ
jgi:hypothetical protein